MVTEPSVARISVNPFMSLPVCVFDVCVFVCLVGKRRRVPQVVQVRGAQSPGAESGTLAFMFAPLVAVQLCSGSLSRPQTGATFLFLL